MNQKNNQGSDRLGKENPDGVPPLRNGARYDEIEYVELGQEIEIGENEEIEIVDAPPFPFGGPFSQGGLPQFGANIGEYLPESGAEELSSPEFVIKEVDGEKTEYADGGISFHVITEELKAAAEKFEADNEMLLDKVRIEERIERAVLVLKIAAAAVFALAAAWGYFLLMRSYKNNLKLAEFISGNYYGEDIEKSVITADPETRMENFDFFKDDYSTMFKPLKKPAKKAEGLSQETHK